MLKSTPALIFIKTVFDVEKCLASRQGLSRRTHVLWSENKIIYIYIYIF